MSPSELLMESDVAPLERAGANDGSSRTKTIASTGGSTIALALAGQPEVLVVLDATSGAVMARVDHSDTVDAVRVESSGEVIYTLDLGGTLRRIDAGSGRIEWEVVAHLEEDYPDLPSWQDGTVSYVTGDPLQPGRVSADFDGRPQLPALSGDGSTLVSAATSPVRTWDPLTGVRLTSDDYLYARTDVGQLTFLPHDALGVDETGEELLVLQRHSLSLRRPGEDEARSTVVVETAPGNSVTPNIDEVVWDGGDTAMVLFSDSRVAEVSLAEGRLVGSGAVKASAARAGDLGVSPDVSQVAVATAEGVVLLSLDGDRLIATGVPRLGAGGARFEPGTSILSTVSAHLPTLGQTPGRWWKMDTDAPRNVERPLPDHDLVDPTDAGVLFSVEKFEASLHDPETLEQLVFFSTPGLFGSEDLLLDGSLWVAGAALGTEVFDATSGEHVVVLEEAGITRGPSRSPPTAATSQRHLGEDSPSCGTPKPGVSSRQLPRWMGCWLSNSRVTGGGLRLRGRTVGSACSTQMGSLLRTTCRPGWMPPGSSS
jgi:hypothetical protein